MVSYCVQNSHPLAIGGGSFALKGLITRVLIMAKQRMINTRFWDDSYISDLDPIEKLMFLYLLTNAQTNISGIYELSIKKIALDTGIDKEMVQKIIGRFTKDKKVFYVKGWVCIKNFIRHQNHKSPKIRVGIEGELENVPNTILKQVIGYGYGIDTLSHLTESNLIKSNLIRGGEASKEAVKRNTGMRGIGEILNK